MSSAETSLQDAYRFCVQRAQSHYENFPVLSRFLPESLKPHVAAIYVFARDADDDADEIGGAEGIARLDARRDRIERGQFDGDPAFVALRHTMKTYNLPDKPFLDLLSAFRQDILVSRYDSMADVLDYCARSANPVGRLILMLFGFRDAERFEWSDRICSALQLINFWQDARSDYIDRGRIYIPREDMDRFGVAGTDLLNYGSPAATAQLRDLIRCQTELAGRMLLEGRPLIQTLPFRLRAPVALFAAGGLSVLKRIRANAPRPSLNDFGCRANMAWTALRLLFSRDEPAPLRVARAAT